MEATTPRNAYAVVALFSTTEIGTSIARSEWPAHLTLASIFAVEAPPLLVARTVRLAQVDGVAIDAHLAGPAMFGPNGDIPVQLVGVEPFHEIHERLAAALERLPGFVADEPEYWHDGYRPHITRGLLADPHEGDVLPIRCIATALLTDRGDRIIDVIDVRRAT